MPLFILNQPLPFSFLAILVPASFRALLAQLIQPVDQVGRAQVKMSRDAPGEQAHMSRGDQFRAGGVAQFAHYALEERLSRLAVAAGGGQRNAVLDRDTLGACLDAAMAMPAAGCFREDLVEARVDVPAVPEIADLVMVPGRRCRRQEHHLEAVLDEGLAAETNCHVLAAPHHDAAGAAYPLKAADTRYLRYAAVPGRLDQGHAGMRVDGKAVDGQGNVWRLPTFGCRGIACRHGRERSMIFFRS